MKNLLDRGGSHAGTRLRYQVAISRMSPQWLPDPPADELAGQINTVTILIHARNLTPIRKMNQHSPSRRSIAAVWSNDPPGRTSTKQQAGAQTFQLAERGGREVQEINELALHFGLGGAYGASQSGNLLVKWTVSADSSCACGASGRPSGSLRCRQLPIPASPTGTDTR